MIWICLRVATAAIDELGETASDRPALPTGELRAAALGDLQPDLIRLAGTEAASPPISTSVGSLRAPR